jgi:transposase
LIQWDMLKSPSAEQTALEIVTLEGLVPKEHLLRRIDAVVDFSFIHEIAGPHYCADSGRPALDPTLMFKALFVGYLFGIRSERRLVEEIRVNVAYRWFLRLKLTDDVFDASTLSQNRRRRFNGTDIAQTIFDRIVEQAMAHGLVEGRVIYTDSTHLKASANKNKYDLAHLSKSRSDYWDDLDSAINDDREVHGKKPMKEKVREAVVKETKVSRVDPDAGYMVRDGKPKGFFYLDHRSVDGLHGIITDSHTTPANVHDSIPYLTRLDRQRQQFGFDVTAVGLDAGYVTAAIARGLEERDILGVTGYRTPRPPPEGLMRKSRFIYDHTVDGSRCANGQLIPYATTDRNGYRHYKSDPAICRT